MKSMKHVVSVLALSAGVMLSGFPVWAQEASAYPKVQAPSQALQVPVHITLLQLNDVYDLNPNNKGRGGLARVATLVKQIEAENPNTFLVLGGDTLSPSVASRLFKGKQMIDAWNAMGMDVAVLGNHEFDYGNDVLLARMKESKFPWVAANVMDSKTSDSFGDMPPYVIKTVDGVKIGFFGLLTPDTANTSDPGENVVFRDPLASACDTVTQLKKQGADVIVALTHQDMAADKALGWQFTPRWLAAILGGHEHTLLQSVAGGVPIYKVASDAVNLGRLDLWVNPSSHRLESMDWAIIPVTEAIAEDPALAAIAANYNAQLDGALGQTVATTTVALDAVQADVRSRETNLGNLIADAYRAAYNADAALLNGGSIRSNTMYDAGPITRKQLLAIMPFNDTIVKTEVTGATLKQALEHGVARVGIEAEAGRFPQVSGIKFSYDASHPAGQRVSDVLVNGESLVADKTYSLVVPNYMLESGDGYTVLTTQVKKLVRPDEAPIDAVAVEEWLIQKQNVSPQVEDRITRLDTGSGV